MTDPEPAAPDVQRVDRVAALAEVRIRRGDDVIQPGADDAERHCHRGEVSRGAGRGAAGAHAALTEQHGEAHAEILSDAARDFRFLGVLRLEFRPAG